MLSLIHIFFHVLASDARNFRCVAQRGQTLHRCRVMKFSALVVVGDGKGTVGYGLGKAAEVSEAILKRDVYKRQVVPVTWASARPSAAPS